MIFFLLQPSYCRQLCRRVLVRLREGHSAEPVRASPGLPSALLGVQPACAHPVEGSLPRAHTSMASQALRERVGSVQRIRCRPGLPPPSLHKLPSLLPSPGIHGIIPPHRLCGALPPVLPVALRRGIPRLERRRPRHPQLLLAAAVRRQDGKTAAATAANGLRQQRPWQWWLPSAAGYSRPRSWLRWG